MVATTSYDIGSIIKSLKSALFGIAIQEGKIAETTAAYTKWSGIYDLGSYPSGSTCVAADTDDKTQLQIKHLMSSTSGWKMADKPARKWVYNNAAFSASGRVLAKAYDPASNSVGPLLKSKISDRIFASELKTYNNVDNLKACSSTCLGSCSNYTNPGKTAINAESTLRHLARFGYLWLCKGKWKSTQVVPSAYVVDKASKNQAITPANNGHYGYGWFVNDGQVKWPAAPAKTLYNPGSGFKPPTGGAERRMVLAVIPEYQIVAVMTLPKTSTYDFNSGYNGTGK
jgi:CubicO group peptidase (beta-lactamase class C family)